MEKKDATPPVKSPAKSAAASSATGVISAKPRPTPLKKLGIESLPESHQGLKFDYLFQRQLKHKPGAYLAINLEGANIKKYAAKKTLEVLPSAHSLSKHVPAIYNQGNIGACVAHSAAQAIRIVLGLAHSSRYLAARMLTSSPVFNPSRLYIYFNARLELGEDTNTDIGSTNYGGMMALRDYKAPDESVWPYEPHLVTKRPKHEAYVAADKHKVFEYSEIPGHGDSLIHGIKDSIHHGAPVLAGVMIFPSFVRSGLNGSSGRVPMPDPHHEDAIGGHSILLVGYDDGTKTFEFVNHWGREWGTGGLGHLPYEFVTDRDLSSDFYAVERFQ